jgi:hypothetical protein
MSKGIFFLVLLAMSLFAFISLLNGPDYLEASLPGGLPFGNFLVAIGLCSMAAAALIVSPQRTFQRKVAYLALSASVVWLPASIALAGNLLLNFSGDSGDSWFSMSLAIFLLDLCSLLLAGIFWLASIFRRGKSS